MPLASGPFGPWGPQPPLEHKPTIPMDPEEGYSSSQEFEDLMRDVLAPGKDYEDYKNSIGSWMLLDVVDPLTGDSVVHRAAAAGNLGILNATMSCFGSRLVSSTKRLLWVALTHQNKNGDTPLHAAARAGNLKGVRGLYRVFHLNSCHPDLDLDDYDEADPPPEFWEWGPEVGLDDYANCPALDFLCKKNQAGRDAAEEAREAGHEDLAVYLEDIVAKVDYEGKRKDEEYMREARTKTLLHYRYFEGEDGKSEIEGLLK